MLHVFSFFFFFHAKEDNKIRVQIYQHISNEFFSWTYEKCSHLRPQARSHLHSARLCPSLTSFTTRSSCLHMRGRLGALPSWEPMWQYMVKITNIQIDITFINPKLIDGVPSRVKGA